MTKYRCGVRLLLIGAGVCTFFLSCSKPAPAARELARVNDAPLTKDMIESRAEDPRQLSEAQIRMYANRWVISELLFQEAKRQGLDESESVKRSLEDAHKQLAVAALLEKEVIAISPADVSAEQVQAYYEKHLDEFTAQEPTLWLQTVVLRNRRSGEEFHDRALARDGGWSRAMEEQKAANNVAGSADSVIHTQSTLYPSELWRLATAMKLHDVSFPVKTSAGYFVMRLLGSLKRGDAMPLAIIEPRIRERLSVELRQQRYSDLIESLRKKNNVQLFYAEKDTLAATGE
ncbi:MAG TPA: peptidylprolyl isomerase [Bacteroidota bacterium]|nr:peptidylprolyl isomerase [Bacteroidota bacterium]